MCRKTCRAREGNRAGGRTTKECDPPSTAQPGHQFYVVNVFILAPSLVVRGKTIRVSDDTGLSSSPRMRLSSSSVTPCMSPDGAGLIPMSGSPCLVGRLLVLFAGLPRLALRRWLRKRIRCAGLGSGLSDGSSWSALLVVGNEPCYEHGCAVGHCANEGEKPDECVNHCFAPCVVFRFLGLRPTLYEVAA